MKYKIIIVIILVLGGILMIFPLFWMVNTSFKSAAEISKLPPSIFPDSFLNLSNYKEVLRRQPFALYMLNSVFISSVSIVASMFFCSLAGYGFAKYDFWGKNALFFGCLAVLMVPFQAIALPLYLWMVKLHLVDSYLGIIAPFLLSAVGIYIMREAIATVPDELIDAARIDGCSEFAIYRRIVLPLVKPSLAAVAIIKFFWTWNAYFWPLIITSSQSKWVVTIGLTYFRHTEYIEHHLGMAAALMSIFPIIAIFIFFQKWVIGSFVRSGLK